MGTEIQSENSKIQHIPSGMKEQESIDPDILRTLESPFLTLLTTKATGMFIPVALFLFMEKIS